GGGLFLLQTNVGTISSDVFEGNTAEGYGGGLALTSSAIGTIRGGRFRGNRMINATGPCRGAGLALREETTVGVVDGNSFSGNSGLQGGGVHCSGSKMQSLSHNHFTRNSALAGEYVSVADGRPVCSRALGGGVYMDTCQLSLASNNTFDNNTAERQGGGMFAVSSQVGVISSSSFVANMGGGVYMEDSNLSEVSKCLFADNFPSDDQEVVSLSGQAANTSDLGVTAKCTRRGCLKDTYGLRDDSDTCETENVGSGPHLFVLVPIESGGGLGLVNSEVDAVKGCT
ncbi:unnamed protein product, partial [Discosporangium mesarthrocarpum]